ncbi:MAG: enoyl-CoA hydratase/isomerase family protein [Streptomyces sp.]|uniref:enoyl-CoA hydratase/isomerase family protein n=1 Tax=Streptomyces sp. TaxID=1931 RepID=UPI0025D84A48|nr:enoyl-CoA hydratase/isomerase family protein [Streptomyces sp.]MBW8802101.1 enoyl-CoA hydratase/isomerase family protein [Streptomyces sp.]
MIAPVAPRDLATLVAAERVHAQAPLIVVDLDADDLDVAVPPMPYSVLIGVTRRPVDERTARLRAALDCTLAPSSAPEFDDRWAVGVPDVDAALGALAAAVSAAPDAAATLTGLLRITATVDVAAGLTAESLAYSMLLAGPEFARWLAGRRRRPVPPAAEPAVLIDRHGDRLIVTLNRPERRNAFGREVRDGLVEAFDLAAADASLARIELRGAGPGFCSGGDLDEFGLTPVVTAHAIRVERSVAARIDAVRDRVHAHLHGACIGAGIELPSFAGRVTAHPTTTFRLPELAMGLVPGAGGTVGITRRVGRWRCAYLALTGVALDVPTALAWGLVDDVAGG